MSLEMRKSQHKIGGAISCGGAIDKSKDGLIPFTGSVNNVFDNILKHESADGVTNYRLVYLYNSPDNSESVYKTRVRLLTEPDSKISVGAMSKGDTGESIASETTPPSGVTFYTQQQLNQSGGYLKFPSADILAPGEHVGLWIKREANASTGSGTITEELVLGVHYED